MKILKSVASAILGILLFGLIILVVGAEIFSIFSPSSSVVEKDPVTEAYEQDMADEAAQYRAEQAIEEADRLDAEMSKVSQSYWYCWDDGSGEPHHLGYVVDNDHLCTDGELASAGM